MSVQHQYLVFRCLSCSSKTTHLIKTEKQQRSITIPPLPTSPKAAKKEKRKKEGLSPGAWRVSGVAEDGKLPMYYLPAEDGSFPASPPHPQKWLFAGSSWFLKIVLRWREMKGSFKRTPVHGEKVNSPNTCYSADQNWGPLWFFSGKKSSVFLKVHLCTQLIWTLVIDYFSWIEARMFCWEI